MRKLSSITESVWNDIRRRGMGVDVKKEDDINLLDRDGLYDYLTSHYKNTNSFEPIYNSETFDTIKVPFLIQGGSDGVYLSFEENEVSIPYASPYKVKGLFSKLANEFSLKSDAKTEHTWYIISPKDGSETTNSFYIEVIDFLIDNIPDSFERGVKKIVTESVWNDIRRRGVGTDVKKEDDVNLLDRQGLVYYLKEHYRCEDSTTIIQTVADGGNISVCLYEDTDGYVILLMYDNIDGDRRLYISGGFKETANYIYDEMCNLYTLTIQNDEDIDGHPIGNIRVEPKGCRYENLANSFFLEVLDFIIERIEKPLEKQIEKI